MIDVHSLEFWLRVKKDYSAGRFSFICLCSATFEAAWDGNEEDDIRYLAKEFLSHFSLEGESGELGEAYNLFFTDCPFIREIFIEWCVEKFSV